MDKENTLIIKSDGQLCPVSSTCPNTKLHINSTRVDACKWKQDGFAMKDYSYWETGCDNLFQFNTGGPEQNHFEFCPFCGKPIEEVTE